jgi:iron complex outermembrane receptor protein
MKSILIGLLCIATNALCQTNTRSDTVRKSVQLHEVTIRDKKSGNSLANKGVDVQSSTDQVLKEIPSVELIYRGSYAPEPMIYGLSAGEINVTLDGMKMFGACTDRMDPISSYVEPNNLKSISVNEGPGPDAQGSTVGGGIDFKLNEPELNAGKEISGLIGAGYQTNAGTTQTLGSLQYSATRFAILINGLYRSAQDYTAGGGEKILYSQYSKWNGGIAAKYQVNNHSYLNLNYLQDDGSNIGFPALTMDVRSAKAKLGAVDYLFTDSTKKLYYWDTKLYANYIHHIMDNSKRPLSTIDSMPMVMTGTSKTIGAYSEAFIKMGSRNIFRAKAEIYQNTLYADMTMYPMDAPEMFMLTLPDGQRSVAGIDLSDNISLSNRWSASFGGRSEYDRSDIVTSLGKAQLSSIYTGNPDRTDLLYNVFINTAYKLTDKWTLNLDIARGMRSSTLKELYGVYLFNRTDNYDYVGNPALHDEQSENGSISATYRSKKFSMEAKAFSYLFQNYIAGEVLPGGVPMNPGAYGVKQYVNIPTANMDGCELKGSIDLSKTLRFLSVNTYTYGEDGNGNALPLIAPFRSVNTLQYSLQKYYLYLESVTEAAQGHVSSFYGETSSPAYSILNFKVSRRFGMGENQLECSIAVTNVLDTYYYEHLDVFNVPRPGRDFIAHVTWFF